MDFLQKDRKKNMMTDSSRYLTALPLALPEREILLRLGYRRARTVLDAETQTRLAAAMERSFRLCRPAGCWRVMDFQKMDAGHLRLADGSEIASGEIVARYGDCRRLWLGAVTIGTALPERVRADFTADAGFDAVVGDAVGSETADAAMDFLQESARQEILRHGGRLTKRRFSPGYGDWGLEGQRLFFALLPMAELGVELTATAIMKPEKSVTALAGIF